MVSKNAERTLGQDLQSAVSPLQTARSQYKPRLPALLRDLSSVSAQADTVRVARIPDSAVDAQFPHTHGQPLLRLVARAGEKKNSPRRVGVLFSGGQASGGHNVVAGLYDALKKLNNGSRLFGFRDGSGGLLGEMRYLDITDHIIDRYRNQGGFDLLGSGRTKIETPEQLEAVKKMAWALELQALVIIGGDDSNTNAAVLAEYFREEKVPCQVLGVPKTIDGDLRNQYIELSFGFDTACKVYSEIIGNIARDCLSAKKYYYFVKTMGRSASHITLECALQTHPNLALIGEELAAQGTTLRQVVQQIANLICRRAEAGKNYGVILIPEGIIEFIPDCKGLVTELNSLVVTGVAAKNLESRLSPEAKECFALFPAALQEQLLLDRDPHGNVQVSKIETERLFIHLVEAELAARNKAGSYKGKFSAQSHFCGYEGRSGFPSNFDSDYCYTLGVTTAVLIESGATGYVAFVQRLKDRVEDWQPGGCPLVSMIHREERKGKLRPVIQKALVDLSGNVFAEFNRNRGQWEIEDVYRYPGPIQLFGPAEVADAVTFTLKFS